jgi:hypothetical protein
VVRIAWAGDSDVALIDQPWREYLEAASSVPLLAEQPTLLSAPLAAAVMPDDEFGLENAGDAAPAYELAAGLDVRVEQKRRKFRSGAVDWMAQRSVAMGKMTDLLLGGADTGWHVVVDPRGADEYILEWKVRFR